MKRNHRINLRSERLEPRQMMSATPLAVQANPITAGTVAPIQLLKPAAAQVPAATPKMAAQAAAVAIQPWQTAVGQALIDQWITVAVGKLNSYNGSANFNGHKTYWINQYGILNGHNMVSAGAPSNFPQYGNNKYWYMWANYATSVSQQPSEWRAAGVPILRDFVNARLPAGWNTSANTIATKFQQLGGANGFLGAPTGSERPTADGVGRIQTFKNGAIYWSPKLGAFEVHGDIYAKWASMGSERSPLGMPTSDEFGIPGARVSVFERGAIYRTPTGTFEVHGDIYKKWASTGYEHGPLGLPVSSEFGIPGARVSVFEHGAIYSTSKGTFEVHGDIYKKWASTGYEHGPLGLPTSDEYSFNGGRRSDFQGGYISWTLSGGAQVHQNNAVADPIGDLWRTLGGASGPLGKSVTNEGSAARSFAGTQGRYRMFEHGEIDMPTTGPNAGKPIATFGLIGSRFVSMGGTPSKLGFPLELTGGFAINAGVGSTVTLHIEGLIQNFEGGLVIANMVGPHAGQAYIVEGAIRNLYTNMGGPKSWLGTPKSDEYNWNGGRRSDFDGGYIFWTAQAGAKTFRY